MAAKGRDFKFYTCFHVEIAIETQHGLMVPKIRDAGKKDITELGKELKK